MGSTQSATESEYWWLRPRSFVISLLDSFEQKSSALYSAIEQLAGIPKPHLVCNLGGIFSYSRGRKYAFYISTLCYFADTQFFLLH